MASSGACSCCGRRPATSRCTRCKRVVYCNGSCQKKDWPNHRCFCGKSQKELEVKWQEASERYMSSVGNDVDGIHQFIKQVGPYFRHEENGWAILHHLPTCGMVLQCGGTAEADQKLVELCSLALEYGADVNAQTTFGDTALHLACVLNVTPMIAFLLEHTPVRLDVRDKHGKTAEQCCKKEGLEVFQQMRHLPEDYRMYLAARGGETLDELVHAIAKKDGPLGTSFVATRNLEPGVLLLRERALAFASNLGNLVELLDDSMTERISELYPRRGGKIGPREHLEICQRNAFSLWSYETFVNDQVDKAPTALFHKASFFNHSCRPNCCWTMVGNVVFVRTVTRIKKGEECFLSYTDLVAPWPIRSKRLSCLGFSCLCERCEAESSNAAALQLSLPISKDQIAQARELRQTGDLVNATRILEKLRSECKDTPSSLGIRETTLDALQLLFFCYLDLNRSKDAFGVASQVLSLYRPFRVHALEYLTWMVKAHPMNLLGDAGMAQMQEYMNEVRHVSGLLHGGGINIFFEQYRKDLGVCGF